MLCASAAHEPFLVGVYDWGVPATGEAVSYLSFSLYISIVSTTNDHGTIPLQEYCLIREEPGLTSSLLGCPAFPSSKHCMVPLAPICILQIYSVLTSPRTRSGENLRDNLWSYLQAGRLQMKHKAYFPA